MKLNQAIEKLIENPKDVYECFKLDGWRQELTLRNGFFYLKIFNRLGEEIHSSMGGGGFNGNISIAYDWQLKRQSVDFLTAFNSGKTVTSTDGVYVNCTPQYLLREARMPLSKINCKWFINE